MKPKMPGVLRQEIIFKKIYVIYNTLILFFCKNLIKLNQNLLSVLSRQWKEILLAESHEESL